jgi:integrase
MKKKQRKGQQDTTVIKVEGYSDGKPREKRLVLPKFSPSWYVYYYNSDLKQKRMSAQTTDVKNALAYLQGFDPFNPQPPDPIQFHAYQEQISERDDPPTQSTIAHAFRSVLTSLKTNAIEGRQVEKYQPKALTNMGQYANRYVRFCEETHSFQQLREYDRDIKGFAEHFNTFLTMIAEQKNPRTGERMLQTARNYKRNLGILGGFLVQEGFIKDNVFRNPLIRRLNTAKEEQGKKKYHTFSKTEFEQIIGHIEELILAHTAQNDAWLTQYRYRDLRVMYMIGFMAGLRRSEVVYLNTNDVVLDPDPKKCYIRVIDKPMEGWYPKTKKSYRNVPLRNRSLISILRRRLEEISADPSAPVYLFTTDGNKRYKPAYLTTNFREIVDALFGHADQRHLHDLRHSWCSYLVNVAKANVYDVQKWAGHESIQTTLGYLEDDTNVNSHLLEFDGFNFD